MRETPAQWTGAERIQWGCVLMRLLGEETLEHLHVVLAGFRSIEESRQCAPFRQAIHTARILLGDLLTKPAVRNAVYEFLDHASARSFTIEPHTLQFRSVYDDGLDPQVDSATQLLLQGLNRRANTRRLADTDHDLVAALTRETQVPLAMHGLRFPAPRQHRQRRSARAPIRIPVSDLRALAEQLDAEDRAENRPSRSWSTRMLRLLAPVGGELREVSELDLSDLKHLIGLPGSGKTTLIQLLCVLLARTGRRVAVFFTSIEVAREYLEILRTYDVITAILVGRSGYTHLRHANELAELIAGDGDGGFARTRKGVELFATNCPLPAFAQPWPTDWPLGEAPCESIREVGSDADHLCPAWELCGRVKNQRLLVNASVWLGHVLSADTTVPAHTSEERLRYFELIAETFDLVIVDECDATQKSLDEYGSLTLHFTGDNDSLHAELQRMTGLLVANRTRATEGMLSLAFRANEFERRTLHFLAEIRRLAADARGQRIARDYADKLLTTNYLLHEMLRATGRDTAFDRTALSALSDLWEGVMYQSFFARGGVSPTWRNAEQYASSLGLSVAEANACWMRLTQALQRYLLRDYSAAMREDIEVVAATLAQVIGVSVDDLRHHAGLLVTVGFTIASYQHLAKSARPLVQRGELVGEDRSAYVARASRELREHVPRSLLGTFSAVRYRRAADGSGYEIDYLVLDLTTRLLLHRLHEIGSAHVLLASATSWLEDSSEYHVAKRPDYVLAPDRDQVGDVRLYVRSLRHPVTGKPLFFSGSGEERDGNLRRMVTALARPELGDLSELERAALAITTPLGRPRKVALVVNSYEQVRLVVDQLYDVSPSLGPRARGVLRELPKDATRARYVLRGQVEALGDDEGIDIVVFPIMALGRGVNIVYRTDDSEDGVGAIGSVYFLTRPHPGVGDLSLMTSLIARETFALDQADLRHLSLAEARAHYEAQRRRLYKRVANLLARAMSASRLDTETLTTFTANLLVPILQTIGRGMRKGAPVRVYFVDAAWAPQSAEDRAETTRSSLLVIMRDILNRCLDHPDPDLRGVYNALYGVFRSAFNDIVGLNPPEGDLTPEEEFFDPAIVASELDPDDDFLWSAHWDHDGDAPADAPAVDAFVERDGSDDEELAEGVDLGS